MGASIGEMKADEVEQLLGKISLTIREEDNDDGNDDAEEEDDDDDEEEEDEVRDELTANELAYAVAACNDCSSATGIRFISPFMIFNLY